MIQFLALLSLLLLFPNTAWCNDSPASSRKEVLTLDQAIALALRDNRLVKNAALEVRKAEDAMASARTHYLPVLTFDFLGADNITPEAYTFDKGIFGKTNGIPIPSTNVTINAKEGFTSLFDARVDQPLLQLYRIHFIVRETELARDLAQEQLLSQRQSISNDVKWADSYGTLQAGSALSATEDSIKYYRELDHLMDRYFNEKKVLKADCLETKAQLARAEYDALTQRNSLSTQQEQLNNLLGRDIRTRFETVNVPEIEMSETDLEAAQTKAVEQRAEVREARLKKLQAETDKMAKKAEYLPDLSLRFSYMSAPGVSFLPENVAMVGMYLKWEFYDWGRKEKELAEKGKVIQQADNAVREAESRVMIDLSGQYNKMREVRLLLDAVRLGTEAARERLRVMTDKYAQESSLLPDVLRAQASLAEANNNYQQALLSFWTARANFEKALGEE